jgi:hypothetical protein
MFYARRMPTDDENDWPEPRPCDKCGEPMVLLGTLRAFGFLPAAAVFKCSECKFSVSVSVGPAPPFAAQRGYE